MKPVYDEILSADRAAAQYNEMWIELIMLVEKCSREEAMAQRNRCFEERRLLALNESQAENCP